MLAFVKEHARHGFIYPMICFAAHTGARRSEILRLPIGDMDLDGQTAILHEKKRAKGRRTMRRVPLSDFLCGVLPGLAVRPSWRPSSSATGWRSPAARTQRTELVPLTRNEAHDQFKRMADGSKWDKLRGWHVLRHSFIIELRSEEHRPADDRRVDGPPDRRDAPPLPAPVPRPATASDPDGTWRWWPGRGMTSVARGKPGRV